MTVAMKTSGGSQAGNDTERGRADLAAWIASKPDDYLAGDPGFERVLRQHLGEAFDTRREAIASAAQVSAQQMDELVRLSNRDENLPRLTRYDDIGRRIEGITFHPTYHELGALVWKTGVLACLAEPGNETLSAALDYFIAHHGEGGHTCPIACTAGAIKLLQQLGTRDQQQRFLPRLTDPDYSRRLHASQFVTEIQGGSDVGANACVATPDPDRPGSYRISGEKWFCSVIDAGVFVVSARIEGAPDGTKGLGIFIVPREIDGEPNAFTLRRLKTKLGTRSMASAETDFAGALAEAVGPTDRGFKNLVRIVLDTSRIHNAVVACGMMRRAYIEAQTFAQSRRAFGVEILSHAMVQQLLARMRMETAAAIATTFRILSMTDRLTREEVGGDLAQARRVHVNINKYWTSLRCTRTVRDGIEVLGGNGAIEDFSVLPRLYRDSIVIESWEGTHNTLCAQVLRDFATRGLHRFWTDEVREAISRLEHPSLVEHRERAERLWGDVKARIGRLLATDVAQASLHVRAVVGRMCQLNSYVSLLGELAWERAQGEADGQEHDFAAVKEDLCELYYRETIERQDPQDHPELGDLYARLSATI